MRSRTKAVNIVLKETLGGLAFTGGQGKQYLDEGRMARRVRAIYDQVLNQWGLLVPPPQ